MMIYILYVIKNIPIWSIKSLCLFILALLINIPSTAQFASQQVIDSSVYGITKIVTSNLSNNGFKDIITSQKYYNNNKISYFLNLGAGSFGPQIILTTNVNSPGGIAAGDLTGNGWNDIVAISQNPSKVLWFPNSAGNFPTEILIDSNIIFPEDVEIVDIDNDGLLDIVVLDHTNIIVYYNAGNGIFNKVTTPNNQFEYYAFAIADIDSDGFKDIIIGSGNVLVYMNDSGSFITHDINRSNSIINAGFCFMIHTADLDGNGTKDLLIDGNANSQINWYSNNGNGYFTFMQTIETTAQCRSISTADFNNDGSLDVFAALNQEGEVALYLNDGQGYFGSKILIASGNQASTSATAAADLDNNGYPDVIWAHPFSFHLNTTIMGSNTNVEQTAEITLTPNPFNNLLHIHAQERANLSVFDILGRCIYHNIPIKEGKFTFSYPLPPQLYLFRFVTPSQISTTWVLKE